MRFLLVIFAALTLTAASSERKVEVYLKDLARLQGVRANQLMGYGVVVGLEGTGDKDQTRFTVQSLTNLMARQGISVNPGNVKVKNVASVMVTAELPPFARSGQRLDITVSSTGDASSLAGGTLLMTPLLGPDNQVYAVAQGSVLVGGFAAVARGGGNAVTKNHPTAGRIPDGALIEREVELNFADRTNLRYALLEDDFSTAVQVVGAINEELGELVAKAQDPRTIDVIIPREFRGRAVELVARLENLPILTQPKSRVVVNEKTGTIIMGTEVRVNAVNIVQGSLSIQVSSTPSVSQPQPFSEGQTAVTSAREVKVTEEKGKTLKVDSGVTVGQLAESLNAMGVTPRDLVAILQAIKDAGALSAELRIL
ncbi:MAG: flagellar basal body P-ring protein FlgI [Holophagales bacterium]|jgi:flagellar P-ring protein precursor FlgI|nr:flagellar basal body P-ring protein FlgI [Holophagales bacterium]